MNTVVLVDNLLNLRQYSTHLLDASSEAVGFPVTRIATGRRAFGDRWMPNVFNADAWIRVRCGTPRTPNMVILDRGHNLGGETFRLDRDDDPAFGTPTTVFTATIPTTSVTGDIDDANGVLTPEGAWLKRFTGVAEENWRPFIPDMGVDLRPHVVGLWLGTALVIGAETGDSGIHRPVAFERAAPIGEETVLPWGWRATGTRSLARQGAIPIRQRTFTPSAAYATDLGGETGKYAEGYPMWIVPDETKGERAFLASHPMAQPSGFQFVEGWEWGSDDLPYIEHQPRLR